MMDQFHFIRPLWLILMPIGILITILLWHRTIKVSNWHQIADAHLIRHLLVGEQQIAKRWPFAGLAIAWILASLALAGPAWERLPQPVYDPIAGRIIIFDLSKSMDSTDITPSRLVRARYKLNDLIVAGRGLQQGLVVFAGDAFTVAPLTDDTGTLLNLVPSLDTNTVPVQGSRSDLGLALAAQLLQATGISHGEIVLITDGISPETVKLAERIGAQGIRISVLAVGTSKGAPIPLSTGGLLKDSNGDIVIPRLDPDSIRQIAQIGAGRYTELSIDNHDIDVLNSTANHGPKLTNTVSNHRGILLSSDQWADNGPWLLLPLLLAAAASFRKGWILSIVLLALPLAPNTANAFGWEELWKRPDQRAHAKFNSGNYDRIPDNAPPRWRGVGSYRAGKFDDADQAFSESEQMTADDHYNRGNALAKKQSYAEAMASYDQAIQLNQDMDDGKFNRDLVKTLLDQQQSQQGQKQNQQENQNKQQDDQKDGQGQNSDAAESDQYQESDQRPENGQNSQPQDDQQDQNSKQGDQLSEENDQEAQRTPKNGPGQPASNGAEEFQRPLSEQELALEQWLKRIPDDPGGLLRRKFAWQYRQRQPQQQQQQQW